MPVAPANVVLGATTAGIAGREGEVLRKTIPWMAATAVLTGAATVALIMFLLGKNDQAVGQEHGTGIGVHLRQAEPTRLHKITSHEFDYELTGGTAWNFVEKEPFTCAIS